MCHAIGIETAFRLKTCVVQLNIKVHYNNDNNNVQV